MAFDLSKNEDFQRLFLLELLVDSVKFDYKKIDLPKTTFDLLKQTCVRFNFLDFPVIEVCEEDFCQTQGDYNTARDIVFRNGKSCFFSLRGLPKKTQCLQLGATIVRQKDEPPPIIMGTTCITLDKGFVDVLNDVSHNTETGEASNSLKDVFPIIDSKGIKIGSLTLLIRLSCFGKAIITHFKIPQEKEAGYMFANTNEPELQMNPAANQMRTPISLGYPVKNNQVSKPDNNVFYSGTNSEAPPGTGIPETVLGSTPMGESYDTAKTSPMIYRGFPNPTPGAQSTSPGDAYSATVPGNFPQATQNNFHGAAPGTFPGISPGTYPGAPQGTFSEAAPGTYAGAPQGTLPGSAQSTYPGTPQGTFPGAAQGTYQVAPQSTFPAAAQGNFTWAQQGTFPGAAPGNFSGTPQGTFPGVAPGTFPGAPQGIFSGAAPGTFPGTATGTYTGLGMFPGAGLGNFPEAASGSFPGNAPVTFPGAGSGTFSGVAPNVYGVHAPGPVYGGATSPLSGAAPGMYPNRSLGTYPGVINVSDMFPSGGTPGGTHMTPAGEPGMPLYNAGLSQYAATYPSEIGMGESMGMYSSTDLESAAIKYNIDNNIRKSYKELSVSINGHEFTINVLRKSRPKKEKPQPLQFCGRIPEIENSDSDETIEEESIGEIEEECQEKGDDEKYEEIPKIEESNLIKKEKKKNIISVPEPPPLVAPTIPQKNAFRLCECDIALPKGFRLPETPTNVKQPNLALPPTPPPSPPDKIPQTQFDSTSQPDSTHAIVKTESPLPPIVSNPVVKEKEKVVKQNKKVEEAPKITYCLQPDCPMGFPWPPNIPQEKRIIKVPCCTQMPMHPASIGLKGDQIIFQMSSGLAPDIDYNQSMLNIDNKDKKSPYVLKLGSSNLPKCKCTKMIFELPVPKLKVKKVEKDETDTQYLESDNPFIETVKVDDGKKKGKGKGKKGAKKGGKKGKKK
ncbi:unnamed protein product [Nezara viridula]|uniref:Uncharacterized protein n=1 Tax=Nezara viridula TaxID=85310 RepID=A0A9P0EHQ3_NEZVI|nr:unnamed protein product [Nezara viridula]